jgi:hypothetical protein
MVKVRVNKSNKYGYLQDVPSFSWIGSQGMVEVRKEWNDVRDERYGACQPSGRRVGLQPANPRTPNKEMFITRLVENFPGL